MDFLKEKATKFFFPEQVPKFGALDNMCLHLGNYAQERITTFTDTDGKTFTFQEYLKSRGLFASRFHVNWFSRLGSANGASQEEACRKPADLSPNDEDTFQT